MNGVERSNDGVKYKGIDLEKIKQVQKVKFSNVGLVSEMVQLDLKKTFSLDDFKVEDSVMDAVRLQIEAHQNKQREDTEMFITCEMAKLFLKEKEKQKRVIERLEERIKILDNTSDINYPSVDIAIKETKRIIEIIKEEVG